MTRPRPTPEVVKGALVAATRQLDSDADPDHVAECLLYLVERQKDLEELLRYTDRYLRFGMPEHELGAMQRLVDRLREVQSADGDAAGGDATLPI
jgi:hypothetical protein